MEIPGLSRRFILFVLVAAGCDAPPDATAPIGSPVPGLTAADLERFRAGEALFNRVFTPSDGVGPLFNENQCSACHTFPAAGGTGEQFLVKATRFTPPDRCDLLAAEGGLNVRTQATPLLQVHGIQKQPLPPSATERGRFDASFLFGLGLVDAIPERDILRHADPEDSDGDGISGRPGRDAEGRLGRFGRKAEFATLADFIENAAHFEMGLTTPLHPSEGDIAGTPFPDGVDPAPDPELDASTLSLLHEFVRFLAPPPRIAPQTAEDSQLVATGERLFDAIGCTSCHVPSMTTGGSDAAALERRTVRLYSDVLLHDLGPEFAGPCGIGATPTELRTGILMGLGRRRNYLHDRRTGDLHRAILLHGGEAAAVREQFRALAPLEQEAVVRFLKTL
jgi:CxxC motif-containing protein (DUF1111 family)